MYFSSYISRKTAFCALSLLFVALSWSCTKNESLTAEQQIVRILTGSGNRYWTISKLFVNDIETPLTSGQQAYYKTYTVDFNPDIINTGTFKDSDGFWGTWTLSGSTIVETFTNSPTPVAPITLIINSMAPYQMDVQYVANGQKVRTVYKAN